MDKAAGCMGSLAKKSPLRFTLSACNSRDVRTLLSCRIKRHTAKSSIQSKLSHVTSHILVTLSSDWTVTWLQLVPHHCSSCTSTTSPSVVHVCPHGIWRRYCYSPRPHCRCDRVFSLSPGFGLHFRWVIVSAKRIWWPDTGHGVPIDGTIPRWVPFSDIAKHFKTLHMCLLCRM